MPSAGQVQLLSFLSYCVGPLPDQRFGTNFNTATSLHEACRVWKIPNIVIVWMIFLSWEYGHGLSLQYEGFESAEHFQGSPGRSWACKTFLRTEIDYSTCLGATKAGFLAGTNWRCCNSILPLMPRGFEIGPRSEFRKCFFRISWQVHFLRHVQNLHLSHVQNLHIMFTVRKFL